MNWWRAATPIGVAILVCAAVIAHRSKPSQPPPVPTPVPALGRRQLCGGRAVAPVGDLVVQADVWGADTPQCLTLDRGGFTVASTGHQKTAPGEPAAFPSVFAGCAAGRCSTNRALPAPAARRLPVAATWEPGTGVWNAVLDVWIRTGQGEVEVMVWSDWATPVEPFGTPAGDVNLAGEDWSVYAGRNRRPVYTYARTRRAQRFDADLSEFLADATVRGWVPDDAMVTSVQAGFELWADGSGATVRDVRIG